ncbi:MAG: hypothetical protein IV100_01300 [Myxococcales bacterium]|nr:hypothetical protein [Myxococcales bacterium]
MNAPETLTTLSPRPKRRLFIGIGGTLVATTVTAVVLAKALVSDLMSGDLKPPSLVLAQLDAAARDGRWDDADAFVDFEAPSRALVPDLWDAADAASRDKMVQFLRSLFRQTWQKYHGRRAMAAGTHFEATRIQPSLVVVENVGFDSEGEEALRYTFEARPEGHRVVNRRPRIKRQLNNPNQTIKSVRGRIETQLGRPPTLAEFVSNAPSWLERVRARKIEVTPEMLGQ